MNAPQEWITYAEATSLTGKSRRTLSRLAKSGDIQATGWGSSRRLLRSDVQRYSPTTACEVVSVSVGTHTLQGLRFGMEEVISTRLIEQTLNYAEGAIRSMLAREWAGQFEEGKHFRVLDQVEMGAVTRTLGGDSPPRGLGAAMHVLTEQGVAKVLMKSNKEVAIRLQDALAESGFMRSVARAVMDRDEQALAQTLSGGDAFAPILQQMLTAQLAAQELQRQQAAATMAMLKEVTSRLDRLEQSPQPTAAPTSSGSPPSWHRCTLRAERIAQMLGARLPKFRKNPALVHRIARDLGLKGLYDEGKDGYTEKRDDMGTHPVWMYSPAAVRMIEDEARNLGHLDFGTGGGR